MKNTDLFWKAIWSEELPAEAVLIGLSARCEQLRLDSSPRLGLAWLGLPLGPLRKTREGVKHLLDVTDLTRGEWPRRAAHKQDLRGHQRCGTTQTGENEARRARENSRVLCFFLV